MSEIIRKYKYILLPCIAVVLAGVGVSFAAYTSIDSIRRVVTTRESTEINAFFSNHMSEYPVGEDEQITKKMIGLSDSNDPKINITVCNYPSASMNHVNKRDIRYSFRATLLDKSGNPLSSELISQFKIEKNGSGRRYSFAADGVVEYEAELLPGGIATQDVFMIYMTAEAVQQVDIRVQAVPTDEASREATSEKELGRKLSFALFAQRESGWSGSFTDDLAATESKKLYGINYALSGGGEGDITVTWNADYLEISPNFLSVYASYITERNITDSNDTNTPKGENYIKLQIGADSAADYFAIPFYRTQAAPETEGWNPGAGVGGSIVPDAGSTDGAYISYSFQPLSAEPENAEPLHEETENGEPLLTGTENDEPTDE